MELPCFHVVVPKHVITAGGNSFYADFSQTTSSASITNMEIQYKTNLNLSL